MAGEIPKGCDPQDCPVAQLATAQLELIRLQTELVEAQIAAGLGQTGRFGADEFDDTGTDAETSGAAVDSPEETGAQLAGLYSKDADTDAGTRGQAVIEMDNPWTLEALGTELRYLIGLRNDIDSCFVTLEQIDEFIIYIQQEQLPIPEHFRVGLRQAAQQSKSYINQDVNVYGIPKMYRTFSDILGKAILGLQSAVQRPSDSARDDAELAGLWPKDDPEISASDETVDSNFNRIQGFLDRIDKLLEGDMLKLPVRELLSQIDDFLQSYAYQEYVLRTNDTLDRITDIRHRIGRLVQDLQFGIFISEEEITDIKALFDDIKRILVEIRTEEHPDELVDTADIDSGETETSPEESLVDIGNRLTNQLEHLESLRYGFIRNTGNSPYFVYVGGNNGLQAMAKAVWADLLVLSKRVDFAVVLDAGQANGLTKISEFNSNTENVAIRDAFDFIIGLLGEIISGLQTRSQYRSSKT